MRIKLLVLAFVLGLLSVVGQKKQLRVEVIWDVTFQDKSLFRLHSLNNGNEYTVMQYDANRNSTIDVYRYDTGKKVRSLLNTRNFPELKSLFQYSLDRKSVV